MEPTLTQAVSWAIDSIIKKSFVIFLVGIVVYLISNWRPKLGKRYTSTSWSTSSVFGLLFLFVIIEYTLSFLLGMIFYKKATAFLSQVHIWRESLTAIVFSIIIFSITWYFITCKYRQPFSKLGFSKDRLKNGLIWGLRAFFVFGVLGVAGLKYYRMGIINSTFEFNRLKIISALITAPIAEEVLFRGYIYPNFRKKLGVILAIVSSVFCFTIVHQLQVGEGWFSIFLRGVVLCWLYEKSGSLVSSIIAHSVLNGVSILRSYLSGILLYIIPWPVIGAVAFITILLILGCSPSKIQEISYTNLPTTSIKSKNRTVEKE